MSGRVWTTLSDGRRVRGFRKTLRLNRRPKNPIGWELVFLPPARDMRFIGLNPGPVRGIIGVRVDDMGRVIAQGRKSFACSQAIAFVRAMAPDYVGSIEGTLVRLGDHQDLGPGHAPSHQTCRITINQYGAAEVIVGTALRAIWNDDPRRRQSRNAAFPLS